MYIKYYTTISLIFKEVRKVLYIKRVILLALLILYVNCIQENCGTGKMYHTSANDSLSIQLNIDTLKLLIKGNTLFYDMRLKYRVMGENSLDDTMKVYFCMSGEHRKPGTQPVKNYEWLNDTLMVWFTFDDDSLRNGDCSNGQVLAKTNCSPVPNYIDVDSFFVKKSDSKAIKIIQNWDDVNDPHNQR
jgi:hypothetical protein